MSAVPAAADSSPCWAERCPLRVPTPAAPSARPCPGFSRALPRVTRPLCQGHLLREATQPSCLESHGTSLTLTLTHVPLYRLRLLPSDMRLHVCLPCLSSFMQAPGKDFVLFLAVFRTVPDPRWACNKYLLNKTTKIISS